MDAIKRNSAELVREAIAAGAKVTDTYHDGKQALEFAQVCSALEAARELIAQGADVNMTVGKKQRTLLTKCRDVGDFGFANLLLEHGADATGLKAEGYMGALLAKANSWAR